MASSNGFQLLAFPLIVNTVASFDHPTNNTSDNTVQHTVDLL